MSDTFGINVIYARTVFLVCEDLDAWTEVYSIICVFFPG